MYLVKFQIEFKVEAKNIEKAQSPFGDEHFEIILNEEVGFKINFNRSEGLLQAVFDLSS